MVAFIVLVVAAPMVLTVLTSIGRTVSSAFDDEGQGRDALRLDANGALVLADGDGAVVLGTDSSGTRVLARLAPGGEAVWKTPAGLPFRPAPGCCSSTPATTRSSPPSAPA